MSFPNIIYGDFGDEKKTVTTKGNKYLGQRMALPDGRMYAYAYSGAATCSVGLMCVQKTVAGTSVNVLAGADAAIGATTVILTMPATTLCTTANQYRDGYLSTNDATGKGYTYKIKTSNTAALAETATFTLYPNDTIQEALVSGTSECTIRVNEFDGTLTRVGGTASVGMLTGIPPVTVAASTYFWIQRRAVATYLASSALGVAGRMLACATAVAGGLQALNPIPADTTTSPIAEPVGYVLVPAAASTEYGLAYLTLD